MKFYSPYSQMTADAASIPDGANVKLFLRHSIRYDNPVDGDYEPLLLTPEGEELARKIGRSLDKRLGFCGSSSVNRCIQTARFIVDGMKEELKADAYKANGTRTDCAGTHADCAGTHADCDDTHGDMAGPYKIEIVPSIATFKGINLAIANQGAGWFKYFHCLQEGLVDETAGITLEQEASPYLDSMFASGGKPDTIDLYASHDCNVVILASALFGLKTGLDGHDWCQYAEGMFLSGSREKFTAWWRGEMRTFEGYALN